MNDDQEMVIRNDNKMVRMGSKNSDCEGKNKGRKWRRWEVRRTFRFYFS